MAVDVTLFTDPACPFAFSAEPVRMALRWRYGDGLRWTPRMIVLTREPGEAELLAEGAPTLQRRHGMPIDPAPYPRPASSEPACLAVVATGLHAPEHQDALLRALRVRVMDGGLLDEPELVDAAAADAGLDPAALREWTARPASREALEADATAARDPSEQARALNHKLGGPSDGRRYSAPSYELARGDRRVAVPGFMPVEACEVAIAALEPGLERRAAPREVGELLDWAPYPLATVEVSAIIGRSDQATRAALARSGARPIPAGADCYWTTT